MRRAVSATVVSGDTVTISVVITDLAGIVMCTAPATRACTIPDRHGGALTYLNVRWRGHALSQHRPIRAALSRPIGLCSRRARRYVNPLLLWIEGDCAEQT